MIRHFVRNSVSNGLCAALALVVLYSRLSWLLARPNDFESWEALYSHRTTERLVGLFIAVDGRNFCEAGKLLGCLFVGGFEISAVSTPWGIEPNGIPVSRSVIPKLLPGVSKTRECWVLGTKRGPTQRSIGCGPLVHYDF